jgi:ACS family D-galactonate transporter-like MFS transporter
MSNSFVTPNQTPTRARFLILSLLLIGTMINYLDRTVMGLAAPSIRRDLGIDAATMGLLLSAFSWTYTAAQLPGGYFLDRFGSKVTYFVSLTTWSLCTLGIGFSNGVRSLLGLRLALGVAEAPCFPANSRVLRSWFPQNERARATSIFSLGMYAGIGFLSVPINWVIAEFGWRALMIGVGALGVVFGFVWLKLYTEPQNSTSANQAELDHIRAGGGMSMPDKPTPFSWAKLGWILRQRQVVGAAIGQFAGNCTLVFFLTWFRSYLAETRNMGWMREGFFLSLPFMAAAVACLTGGFISDKILRRTGSATLARKLPITIGFCLAATIVLANYVTSDAAMIAVMCVSFFGQGWINLGWALITDVAPRELQGLTTGFFNFVTNLAGIITPLVVGLVLQQTGSYAWGLAFIAMMSGLGFISYLFVVGEVKRLEFEPKAE